MATVPTTGLSGFFGGLADVLQASTPLLSAILPPLISRGQQQPIFLGGGPALPAGQIPGFFPDPRVATTAFPATQAMGQNQFGQFQFLSPGGQQLGGPMLPAITAQQGACPPRLPARIDVPSPSQPGRFVTFKNMGAPVLFRGDLAACKRARRVGRMVKKSLGGGGNSRPIRWVTIANLEVRCKAIE